MTPLAHIAMRELLAEARQPANLSKAIDPNRSKAHALATAVCFDLTPVADLVDDTGRGIAGAMTEPLERSPVDHGGLIFAPAPSFWLEQRGGNLALGALVRSIPSDTGSMLRWQGYTRPQLDGAPTLCGFLEELRNEATGEPAVWARYTLPGHFGEPADAPANAPAWRNHALWVISALLAVNAPRGFLREERPVHRGLLREARAAGVPELKAGYTIQLDDHRSPETRRLADPRSRQGLHFVRSHRRQLGPQRTAQVRAHWKGSAEFGILLGDRLVKSGGRR